MLATIQTLDDGRGTTTLTRRIARVGRARGGALLAAPYLKPARASAARAPLGGKNVIVFITDQDRAIQHFPGGRADANLPGLTRLQQNGLTFNNAFTNCAMCSPARSTMLKGKWHLNDGCSAGSRRSSRPGFSRCARGAT